MLPQAVAAQGADQFFKGKTINLYIGFGPGGTYDYYGRLAARYLGRYLPGEPTVVAQSMPGSGGLRAANYLFSAAPKDGTAIGVIPQTAAIEDALRNPGVQYKAAEFNWIGRMTAILEVHFTWKTSKGKTIEDARQHEIPLAGTGSGSPSEGYPKLLNAFAGTKFKIISGYPSSTEGMIAMERGEVDGALTSWNTVKRTRQHWIKIATSTCWCSTAPSVIRSCATFRPFSKRQRRRRAGRRWRSISAVPSSAVRWRRRPDCRPSA